jgi:hypothetical protein
MADYKGIQGFSVETLATDPLVLNAWSTEGNIGTGRYQHRMAGTTSAALLFQGNSASPYDNLNTTETWNGTSWASANNAPFYTRAGIGWGTQSSAICGSGYAGAGAGSGAVTTCGKFDGTSWSVTGSTVTTSTDAGGVGADGGSGIMAGGWCPGLCTASEVFNGSSWATTNNTQSPGLAVDNGCAGIKTSAMLWGSDSVPNGAGNTQTWNDTCWATSPAAMVGFTGGETAIQNASGTGASNTSAISAAGQTKPTGTNNFNTMQWDGTSWTAISASIATPGANKAIGCTGTKTAAMITGGTTPTPGSSNQCQTFTGAPAPASARVAVEGQMWYNTASNVLKTFGIRATAAFATSGSLAVAKTDLEGAGNALTAIAYGGTSPPGAIVGTCETFDGSTWSAANSLVQPSIEGYGCGSKTSALNFGGLGPTSPNYLNTGQTWNDTCWAASPATFPLAAIGGGCAGSKTSAVTVNTWNGSSNGNQCFIWNDTSWSTSPATSTQSVRHCWTIGTKTAALSYGGYPGSTVTEEWNDTSWASKNALPGANHGMGGSGTVSAGLMYGGAPFTTNTFTFDGTNWASNPASMVEGRNYFACSSTTSTQTNAFLAGGGVPAKTAGSQVYIGAQEIKTVTAT